jgi:hypothetical protein
MTTQSSLASHLPASDNATMTNRMAVAAIVAGAWVALPEGPSFAAPPTGPAPAPAPSGRVANASPDQEESARQRFNQGVQLYDEGDYKLALIEFTKAYELVPNYRVLYNIGEVNAQLGNYAAAIRTLEQYLQKGGAEIPAARRAAVEQTIASLRPRTATLTIRAAAPGATPGGQIELDGNVLTDGPVATQMVDGGEHRVRVTKTGFLPYEKTIVLGPGDASDISVTLERQRSIERPALEPSASHPEVWIGWTATGVFAIGAVVTGALALKYDSDLNTLVATPGSSSTTRQSDANSARTFAYVTDGLIAATGFTGAVALYFTLHRRTPSSTTIGVGPGAIRVEGRF